MVIITAATVVLVLVSANYALQVLTRQQGTNEYDTVKKSLLTFDDAFRDIAFDRGGSRSVRFTTNYGYMELVPDNETLTISIKEPGITGVQFSSIEMGAIKYHMPTSYVTYGYGYSSYVLGNDDVAVSSATDSLGRLYESQFSDSLTLGLDYRVRVTREGPSTIVGGGIVNYVDILLVRMNITKSLSLTGDFDLTAKNLDVTTRTISANNGGSAGISSCTVVVNMSGGARTEIPVTLDSSGKLVFNLIIADVKVGN
jgi:hypothetical protein